ncbi:MAG: tetratricopeptide repeat protein [Saprospiraceae bacterium]
MRKLNIFLSSFLFSTTLLFAQFEKGIKPAVNGQQLIVNGQQSIVNGQQSIVNNQKSIVNNTYAVVVGISDYQDPGIPDLRFADRDAEAFKNYLRSNAGGNLDGDHLKVLINEKATMAQFANALDWLIENAKEGDQSIIYFSGHGDVEKKTLTQPGFLLCWDAPARVYMAGGAFNLRDIQEVISTLTIQNKSKVIVITDACRSGTLAGSSVGGSQATAANLAKQYANEIKIMSCQPNEYSIEGEQWGGGRGVFSFHLIDALYGLADKDDDQFITLQEVGRYLEDHVSEEVAPIRQVPMISGDRYQKLSIVDTSIVNTLKSGKTNQSVMLVSIESKGIEEQILSTVDTSIKELYRLFKKSLKDKIFLEPKSACADTYYEKLIAVPKLEHLFSTMRRNYASALQDDAQQVINKWLISDPNEIALSKVNQILKYQLYPSYLDRAIELLGKQHYMYSNLYARKLFFEGYLKHIYLLNLKVTNREFGESVLKKYREALQLQPESPHIYSCMMNVYFNQFQQLDSAEYCARRATELAPRWFLPYSILGGLYAQNIITFGKITTDLEKAKIFIELAEKTDSFLTQINAIHLNCKVSYYLASNQVYKAEMLMKELIQLDSTNSTYYDALGTTYLLSKRYEEAEEFMKKAILKDSTAVDFYYNLGIVYFETFKYKDAERLYKKVIQMDSNYVNAYYNLGVLYSNQQLWIDAERQLKKVLKLDSTDAFTYNQLGFIYEKVARHTEAEKYLLKSISLDSTNLTTQTNLGMLYIQMNRISEAEWQFNKILNVEPGYSIGMIHLGEVYLKLNRVIEAEKLFSKAIQQDSDNSLAFLHLAVVYSNLKSEVQSWKYLEEALKKSSISFEMLQIDLDVKIFREQKEKWDVLMKKYFPDKIKN